MRRGRGLWRPELSNDCASEEQPATVRSGARARARARAQARRESASSPLVGLGPFAPAPSFSNLEAALAAR